MIVQKGERGLSYTIAFEKSRFFLRFIFNYNKYTALYFHYSKFPSNNIGTVRGISFGVYKITGVIDICL